MISKPKTKNFLDIEGQAFGRWTVIEYAGRNPHGVSMWTCQCACGTLKTVQAGPLRKGTSISCGCHRAEQLGNMSRTHGNSSKPEYFCYQGAKRRCTNPKDRSYKHYGGRGIEFRFNSFEEFLEAVGHRPDPSLSVDRIDVNGHYEASNLRWADVVTQRNNQRR